MKKKNARLQIFAMILVIILSGCAGKNSKNSEMSSENIIGSNPDKERAEIAKGTDGVKDAIIAKKVDATISKEKTSGGYDKFVKPDTMAIDVWYDPDGNPVGLYDLFLEQHHIIHVRETGGANDVMATLAELPCTVGELEDVGFYVLKNLDTMTTGETGLNLTASGWDGVLEITCEINDYKNGYYEPLEEDKLGNCLVTHVETVEGGLKYVEFHNFCIDDSSTADQMCYLFGSEKSEDGIIGLGRYPEDVLSDGLHCLVGEDGQTLTKIIYAYNFEEDMKRLLDEDGYVPPQIDYSATAYSMRPSEEDIMYEYTQGREIAADIQYMTTKEELEAYFNTKYHGIMLGDWGETEPTEHEIAMAGLLNIGYDDNGNGMIEEEDWDAYSLDEAKQHLVRVLLYDQHFYNLYSYYNDHYFPDPEENRADKMFAVYWDNVMRHYEINGL